MFSTSNHELPPLDGEYHGPSTLLTAAYHTPRYGGDARPLPVYDDGWPNYYVYGCEFGPEIVIAARTWEDAIYIAIDECGRAVPDDEYEYEDDDRREQAIENGEIRFTSDGRWVFAEDHEWLESVEQYNERTDCHLTLVRALY